MIRQPLATSFRPPILNWQHARGEVLRRLQEAYGHADPLSFECITTSTTEQSIAYCRVTFASGRVDFAKLTPPRLARRTHLPLRITAGLGHTTLCPQLVPNFPQTLGDGFVVISVPYVDGSYLDSTTRSMELLGQALARLHIELRAHSESARVARYSQAHRSHLRRKAAALLANSAWCRGSLESVRNHVLTWLSVDEAISLRGAQIIHNDLNIGNILIAPRTGIHFLDFEESANSFLPNDFDVAKVVERFIMVDDSLVAEAKCRLLDVLVENYNSTNSRHPVARNTFAAALSWHLGLAWLRLGKSLNKPIVANHPEVQKFLRLAEIIDKSKPWLNN